MGMLSIDVVLMVPLFRVFDACISSSGWWRWQRQRWPFSDALLCLKIAKMETSTMIIGAAGGLVEAQGCFRALQVQAFQMEAFEYNPLRVVGRICFFWIFTVARGLSAMHVPLALKLPLLSQVGKSFLNLRTLPRLMRSVAYAL